MKNKYLSLISIVITFVAIATIPITSFAAAKHIIDDADIFTTEQETALLQKIEDIRDTYNFDITFITTNTTNKQSLKSYIDNHSALDLERDGIVFGQDVVAREYHTTGRNYGAIVVSDAALDRIDEVVVPYLRDGDYFGAYDAYLDETIKFLEAANSGTPYEGEPLSFTNVIVAVAISLIGGFVVSFFVTSSMKSKMNTAKKKREAENYVRSGSFMLAQNYDRFLYENTTRTAKSNKEDNSNDSKGGSGGGKY